MGSPSVLGTSLLSSKPSQLLLLAVRVVQIDPLVGTTAAWRTMPLSRGPFLWAKLLLVAAAVAGRGPL